MGTQIKNGVITPSQTDIEDAIVATRTYEAHYLGALVTLAAIPDPAALGRIQELVDMVPVDNISDPKLQEVYKVLVRLVADGDAPSVDMLVNAARCAGTLDKAGGFAGISHLANVVPSAVGAEQDARLINEAARMRNLQPILRAGLEAAVTYNPRQGLMDVDVVEQLQTDLAGLDVPIKTVTVVAVRNKLYSLLNDATDVYNQDAKVRNKSTVMFPWPNVGAMVNGIRPGAMCVVAAGTGAGKTIFACDVARYGVLHRKQRVLYATAELPEGEILDRIITAEAGLDYADVCNHCLDLRGGTKLYEYTAAGQKIAETGRLDIIYDNDLRHIIRYARSVAAGDGLDLIIVDHLQFLRSLNDKCTEAEDLDERTKILKDFAVRQGVAVLAVSQLNRSGADTDKRPTLDSIRGSAAITHNADSVLALYREPNYDIGAGAEMRSLKAETDVIVLKNRHGRTGTLRLVCEPEHMTFRAPTTADMPSAVTKRLDKEAKIPTAADLAPKSTKH